MQSRDNIEKTSSMHQYVSAVINNIVSQARFPVSFSQQGSLKKVPSITLDQMNSSRCFRKKLLRFQFIRAESV